MRKTAIPLILSLLVLLTSCGDPNIYSHMGYDPSSVAIPIRTVQAHKGVAFDLLTLAGSFGDNLAIHYTPEESYVLLVSLDDVSRTQLVQKVDYLSRYGNLEEYLVRPMSDEEKAACTGTIAFVLEIADDLEEVVMEVLKAAGTEVDVAIAEQAVQELFDEFSRLLKMECEDVEDYISMQLVEDTIASCLEMLYIILVDIPKDAIEYTWDTIIKDDTWNSEELIASISRNAALLVQTLLDAVADIDQVSSRIPSFVSLNTIVDEVLQ